jgi:hypothetical protein
MFSLFGWTPSLRRMLRGRILPCGCTVGVYETRSGDVVRIIDARSSSCESATHAVDAVVTGDDPDPDYTHTPLQGASP